jgi:uncharacterized protein YbaP (TraB family)
MIDTSGKQLSEYFTHSQMDTIRKYFHDNLGMDMSMLQTLKPFALMDMLVSKFKNCDSPTSYEDSLLQLAFASGKEITGLESPEEQVAVLEHEPLDSVIHDIMQEINAPDTDMGEYDAMITAYKRQDLPLLYQLLTAQGALGSEKDVLLDDRNTKWISRMKPMLDSGNTFFAVGAGHLWGDNGVIALLRRTGYKVEAVY